MKKLLVFCLIILSTVAFSQTKLYLKNAITKKPVSFIMIFNEKNEIVGKSNDLGEVHLKKTKGGTNSIVIKSIFYEAKEIALSKLKNNETILLTPIVNLLDEVDVSSKKKYPVLTAYCRVYGIIDDELVSFVDAEVKYFIKKNAVQKSALNFRIFDKAPVNDYKVKNKNPYWIPKLDKASLFEKLAANFNLIKEKDSISVIGRKDEMLYGIIKTDTSLKNNSNIRIEILRDSKYFGIIKTEAYYNDDLLKTTIKDIRYQSKVNIFNINEAHEKLALLLEDVKERVFSKREIFVQDIEYISKDEYRKIKRKEHKDHSVSHYTKEFWKNLDNYTPLDSLIQKQLKNDLIERKPLKF